MNPNLQIEKILGWYYVFGADNGKVSRWPSLDLAKKEFNIQTGREWEEVEPHNR